MGVGRELAPLGAFGGALQLLAAALDVFAGALRGVAGGQAEGAYGQGQQEQAAEQGGLHRTLLDRVSPARRAAALRSLGRLAVQFMLRPIRRTTGEMDACAGSRPKELGGSFRGS